jgi:pimeloyl-ACP methyl ester carboxylesterase
MTTKMEERLVSITPDLHGRWARPAGAWDGRCVLFLHGFADDMDSVGKLTKRLAGVLAERGVASLRINFRGEGDYDRTEIDSTLATRTEDTARAYAFMAAEHGVATGRVGVVGWSLGATTAIVVAAAHPGWFRSMVVWAAPTGDQWAGMSTSETAQRALREGQATQAWPGWKTITTKRAFYESFRGVNVDHALAQYPGAFLSVRGSLDHFTADEAEFLNRAPGLPRESVILGGASHIFSVFEPASGHADRAIGVTADWLQRTL